MMIDELVVGRTPAMCRLKAEILRLAGCRISVLIMGPTGAGKEFVARALHAHSGRSGSLVPLNACAIPDSMFEATLFGHAKGAFTGALADRIGSVAEADRGSLFLDEIGGISYGVQLKLLRVVDTKTYRPLGARADRLSDFRLISATNDNVDRMAASGTFRLDLLQRLRGATLCVPPLKDRPEDIPLLLPVLLRARGLDPNIRFDSGAIDELCDHEWPGNLRELHNVLENAVSYAGGVVAREHIAQSMGAHQPSATLPRLSAELEDTVAVCREHGWDVHATADVLGLHRSTIFRRLHRAGVFGEYLANRRRTPDGTSCRISSRDRSDLSRDEMRQDSRPRMRSIDRAVS